jgi:hypothetical protein
LSSFFFTKQVIAADLELMLSSCFKYFLHQWYGLSTSSLRNKLLIEFLSENFLVFLSTSKQYPSLIIKKNNYCITSMEILGCDKTQIFWIYIIV